MENVKEITSCRLCGSQDIPIIWDWGNSPLANAYRNKEDLDRKEFEAPLVYCKCAKCNTVQLKYEIDSQVLFKDYAYETPSNLISHFKELAKTTTEFLGIDKNDRIIDIGSNTGLLLQEFKNLGYKKCVGFEPCDRIAQKARDKGIGTFSQFFNGGSAEEFALQYKKAELITCTNCFAHVSDLNEFIEGLRMVLAKNGYFVFENCHLLKTLENHDFCQSYFEHFYLHNLLSLKGLFDKYKLELFHVEHVNVQMGSIRGYVKRKDNLAIIPFENEVEKAIEEELKFGLDKIYTYKKFIENIDYIRFHLVAKLQQIKNEGGTVSMFAWPAKCTLLVKYFELEPYIDYVIEEAPSKIGKIAPGAKLEIRDVNYFKRNPTTHCIIGAYNFEKDIKTKQNWYQGEWINPLKVV